MSQDGGIKGTVVTSVQCGTLVGLYQDISYIPGRWDGRDNES